MLDSILFKLEIPNRSCIENVNCMVFRLSLPIIAITFLFACRSVTKNDDEAKLIQTFNRSHLENYMTLTSTEVEFSKSIHSMFFYLLRDSLILIENRRANPYFYELYSLNRQTNILEFGMSGKGPNELLSAYLNPEWDNAISSQELCVVDVTTHKAYVYNIDSLLKLAGSYNPIQFTIPSFSNNIGKWNENHAISWNLYYLDDPEVGNSVDLLVDIQVVNGESSFDSKKLMGTNYTYNVSGGYVIVSPNKTKIICPYKYEDRIDIFNGNKKLIKSIKGPDDIENKYLITPQLNNLVGHDKEYYEGYRCKPIFTTSSVYCVYSGAISNKEPYELQSELFVLNWDGEIIKSYHLDKYLMTISVNSGEDTLYGTTKDSMGDNYMVKYALN